jgi:hypothetical protein
MKFPRPVALFIRRLLGTGEAPGIDVRALRDLAAREPVLVVAMGSRDPSLPGEQVDATPSSLESVVRSVPRDRAIVTHCG